MGISGLNIVHGASKTAQRENPPTKEHLDIDGFDWELGEGFVCLSIVLLWRRSRAEALRGALQGWSVGVVQVVFARQCLALAGWVKIQELKVETSLGVCFHLPGCHLVTVAVSQNLHVLGYEWGFPAVKNTPFNRY